MRPFPRRCAHAAPSRPAGCFALLRPFHFHRKGCSCHFVCEALHLAAGGDVPGASSAISTAINCCRATICRRALTEASGLGTKSCFAPPGRRLSTGGWTVRSKQVTHLHGQSTNTKIAPQVPQPQEVKCTTWEPRRSSSRVLPEQHRRRKGNTAEAG